MRDVYPVKRNKLLNQSYFILEVDAPQIAKVAIPGQFCQLLPRESTIATLRIPISIYEVDGKLVRFMIKSIGQGTSLLSKMAKGEMLDIIGPLGNGFQYDQVQNPILISGGVGHPPLAFLKSKLVDISTYWLHGGHCWEDTFPCDKTYTEDGSVGVPGLVTTGLKRYLAHHNTDHIFACGPKAMLATCVKIAKAHKIPIQVSMEEYMACGIGVCYGCVVRCIQKQPNDPLYKRVCKDGPIFNGYEVKWDE
jgi:dihydroorotate dehydrogenase electron transfer subunit